jgi:hypothetical protein
VNETGRARHIFARRTADDGDALGVTADRRRRAEALDAPLAIELREACLESRARPPHRARGGEQHQQRNGGGEINRFPFSHFAI